MFEIFQLIVDTVSAFGYVGIFILMTIESSFIPFPSEIIMIPAGYLAYQDKMNIYLVVLFGVLGSIAGALINYYLSLYLGRALILKYGKYFLIDEEKLNKVEDFFKNHGAFSTFSGRLIPMIRQLISIPAGLGRMNMPKFIFYTSAGAGIWVVILSILGYFIGHNQSLIEEYLSDITISILIAISILAVVYVYFKKNKSSG